MAETNKKTFFIRRIVLYAVVITLVLIVPVCAQIINGDFETGDLTGWDTNITSNNVLDAKLTVYSYAGDLGCEHKVSTYAGGSGTVAIYQDVDLSNRDNITILYRNFQGAQDKYCRFIINNDIYDLDTFDGVWRSHVINVSQYSGVCTIRYEIYAYHGYVISDCKNIELFGDGVNSINYNPDIPVTNIKPFDLSYTLNSTYAGDSTKCEIFAYECYAVNGTTGLCAWYNSIFQGYVNDAFGSYTTNDYFHGYGWPKLNKSYMVGLYSPESVSQIWGTPETILSDPYLLDYDIIYVNYSWNSSDYPDPTPQPTPDPTPSPTPSGTPTPEPTATSQPDPEPINESLNGSFTEGYHILVDGTVDGFFTPVYNFTDYIAQPLTGLNQTLCNFTVLMDESFNTTSLSLGISTSILFTIMSGFPQKVINVFAYYLIWVIILIIFKGET